MSFAKRYGPWALVTGASSGIGREFAVQLARRGLNLVLVARRKERLDDLAQDLERRDKIQVRTLPVDLSTADFMADIAAATQAIEVNLVVNNAGFGLGGGFLDHEIAKEIDLLAVNCRAPLILAHVFGRRMKERKKGGIIFVASVSGYLATPGEASYAASKVFELSLAESLWYELKQYGIDVLALCPGNTTTEFHELAGIKNVAPMRVEPVVAAALKNLGKGPSIVTGWRNRLLVAAVKFAPRRMVTAQAGKVMKKLVIERAPARSASGRGSM